jgi:hypothetical protein
MISLFGGYSFGWKWTGFVKDASFHKRTLWDWLQLLIIPAVLAGGGLWFNRQQREQELRIAAGQREQELKTANTRAQDESLQAYLDQISLLLTDKERPLHRARPGDNLGTVARARTLTVLGRLDGIRKRSLLQFLYESNLVVKGRPILGLTGADLSGADLSDADLTEAIGISGEELELGANSLKGATMPDGQKYEDWLKYKESRREDEA